MKIIILTCYHKKEINPRFIQSLMDLTVLLTEMKVEYEYWASEEPEIDRSKNKFIDNFLKTDFTHLFIVNPDISWDNRGMARILKVTKNGAELVAGIYPQYGIFDVTPITEDGYIKGYDTKEYRLAEAKFVNGGFIIYNRKAFERVKSIMESYIEKNEIGEEYSLTEFFKSNKGLPRTDDIYFQKKFIEQGGQILVEPNITFEMLGKRKWKGNYNQSLLGIDPL